MQEFYPLFQKIYEQIKGSRQAVVISHQNPDGDAVGSLLGLGYFLEFYKVPFQLFCKTPVPEYLKFLPKVESISQDYSIITDRAPELVIVLDSGDLEYAGIADIFQKLNHQPIIINIDHHQTNQHYGHINLVHPKASSTAEIIFHLLDYFRLPIDKYVATQLLTGIITDTGNFSNLGTTPSSMEVSSRLMNCGARVKEITYNTMKNKPLSQLQLWGRALSRLKKDPKTGIISTVLTQRDFMDLNMSDESSEGIANFLNNMEKAKAILVLREKSDGTIKGSLRTTEPEVDVSKIAEYFGGGGHKKAAGFTIKGRIQETETGWKII